MSQSEMVGDIRPVPNGVGWPLAIGSIIPLIGYSGSYIALAGVGSSIGDVPNVSKRNGRRH